MPGESDSKDRIKRYTDAADDHDDAKDAANAVFELFITRAKSAGAIARRREESAAGDVLASISKEHGDAAAVIDVGDEWLSDCAKMTGTPKDTLREPLLSSVEDLREKEKDDELDELDDELADEYGDSVDWSLDNGYALDEYLETIEDVIKSDNEDVVSDPDYIFKFEDGAQVELADGNHLIRTVLYRAVESASDEHIRNEIASYEAAKEIDVDDSEKFEREYSWRSNGPATRPWGLDGVLDEYKKDAWNECITDLVQSHLKKSTRGPGPRSSAWKRVRQNIVQNPAATDKQSVTTVGKGSYYDEEHEEFWVPNGVVMDACEEFGIESNQLVHELHERGVVSDELAGRVASYPDSSVRPETRFWRFDASHEKVQGPVEYVESMTGTSDDEFGSTSGRETYGGEA
ncbi:hypothetical protein [Halorubrum sp. SD626R]|uniref:hypothetical protein n=1 Tax=Halorubrum sp. SD626R TaxID=1419722 RepID=UPI000B16336A|nr:hypothetical protein [Halorubrum sp. SD626R]TKX79412.1 hypothetical protein EXE53_15925 [Halorubrum sp. SD626R]